MKIEDKLRQNAKLYPDDVAVVCGEQSLSYSDLYKTVCVKARTMEHQKGRFVPIEASTSIDFLVTYFAVHLVGGIAVPLDKSVMRNTCDSFPCGTLPDGCEGIADVLYTTGTTGKAKGVMVSHDAIVSDAENLVDSQCFTRDLTYVITGPLNHIGSLSKVYPTIYVGGTICLVDGMKDVNAFFSAIDKAPSKVATFLVPSSIRMLLALSGDKLSEYANKMDFIETGAAPMPLSDMQTLCRLLPASRLYNTYASTETGIISTYNFNGGDCIPGCLGVPMKHSSFFITDDGRVACKGKTLMSGYWENATAARPIVQSDTIVTSDIGSIDQYGRLHLTGRNDDVLNIGGFKVNPVEVENIALSFPGVKDCICISAPHPVVGQVLKLLVVPQNGYCRKTLAGFLKTKLETYKVPSLYGEVEKIRRTYNGKLDRKSYCPPSLSK